MANRHLLRTIALQTLFEWDFNYQEGNLDDILDTVSKEFASGHDNLEFSKQLVDGVIQNQTELDETITKYAPEWPIAQVSVLDRNILRLGIYEMLHIPETPTKVAINEAVEMGKHFGGESSGKFVNGVLGALYKDLPAEQVRAGDKA